MEHSPAKNNVFKKFYLFLQTDSGISLIILLYCRGLYRLGDNLIPSLFYALGEILGYFTATYIVILVLSRKFKWSRREKIVNGLLLVLPTLLIQRIYILNLIQHAIFILFLIAEIVLLLMDFIRSITRAK